MNFIVSFLIGRLSEPSSYAGIAGIAQAFKYWYPEYAGLFDNLTMAMGAVAVAMREKK